MKKTFLLCLLLGTQINLGFTQITFEKAYRKLLNVEIAKSCDLTQDGGYIIGVGEKLLNSSPRLDALIKLNAYGDTIWYSPFQIQNNTYNLQLVRSAVDGGYYASGIRTDSTFDHNYMIWILKMDSVGNVLWVKNYTNFLLDAKPHGNTMRITPTGNIIMFLSNHNILTTDSNGILDTLMAVPFYPPSTSYYFKKINMLAYDTSYYYFGGVSGVYSLAKINYNGILTLNPNLIIQPDTGIIEFDILKKTNHNYYTCSFSNFTLNGKTPFTFSKFDSTGAKIWNKFYSYIDAINYSTSYKTLANGNNIASFIPMTNGVNPPAGRAAIFCFNDNGDSLWYKKFSPTDTTAKTDIYDVIATPDSGLLAVGQIVFSNGQQKSYIVKLDANGNLFNPLSVVEKKNETYLHIYPNPATTYTGIHYLGAEKNVLLSINDLQGQEIYKEQLTEKDARITLNTSQFKPGFYFCNLISDGKLRSTKKLIVLK